MSWRGWGAWAGQLQANEAEGSRVAVQRGRAAMPNSRFQIQEEIFAK